MPAVSPSLGRPPVRRADPPVDSPRPPVPGWLVAMLAAGDLPEAAQHVVDAAPRQLAGCCLAVGWAGHDATCTLLAATHRERFDPNGDQARSIEAALDESLVRAAPLAAPAPAGKQVPARTHERLRQLLGSGWVCSLPLVDAQGTPRGSVLIWGDPPEQRPVADAWLHQVGPTLAAGLANCQRASQGAVARALQTFRQATTARRNSIWLALLLAGAALLAIPLPHHVRCDCTIEPVVRRFVAAPFDATLLATLVEPGDVVTAGQPVVRLEGREIQWELAGLTAQFEKAQKSRDRALAERETSTVQLAELEIEQLEHQMALLQDRQEHLTVVSPIDGVVLSGDLSRDVGAPVTTGQTLLEIAPLDRVVVEAAVAEDQIALVAPRAPAAVRLDAMPHRRRRAALTTIHPQAELRDHQQVFIAELPLENIDRSLRPGMQGVARIEAGRATLGWKLFHRPYYALTGWLGW